MVDLSSETIVILQLLLNKNLQLSDYLGQYIKMDIKITVLLEPHYPNISAYIPVYIS